MSDTPEGANIDKLNEIKWIHWQITFLKRTEKTQVIKNSENLIHAWNLQFILFCSSISHQRRKNIQQSPFLSSDPWDKNSGFSLQGPWSNRWLLLESKIKWNQIIKLNFGFFLKCSWNKILGLYFILIMLKFLFFWFVIFEFGLWTSVQ